MPTVAAGSTASYTLPSQQQITLTFDQGERAEWEVRRSGVLVASGSATTTRTIGPFNAGDVLSITASRGAVDYAAASYSSVPGDGKAQHRLAQVGDSYLANGKSVALGETTAYGQRTFFAYLAAMLGDPFDMVVDAAVAGTNSGEWFAQIAQVMAEHQTNPVGWCLLGFPNNDPVQIGDYAASVANMAAHLSALTAAGIRPILMRRGAFSTWTPAQRQIADDLDAWIAEQARNNGWPLLEQTAALVDQDTGAPSTVTLVDESGSRIHPNALGQFRIALLSRDQFAGRVQPRPLRRVWTPDQVAWNPMMGGDASGLPSGWSSSALGVTGTTHSKAARPDGAGTVARVVATSAAAGNYIGFTSQLFSFVVTRASNTAIAQGLRRVGPDGNQYVAIVGGTTAASAPTFDPAIGAQTVDGTVTWARAINIVPGVTRLRLRAEYEFSGVSGGDLGVQCGLYLNYAGSPPGYTSVRSLVRVAPDACADWSRVTATGGRRPIQQTPATLVPAGATGVTVLAVGLFSAAGTAATFDLYGVDVQVIN